MCDETRFVESDIRPEAFFKRFLDLCAIDAVELFPPAQREERPCPGCDCSQAEHAFDKWGFAFVTCVQCGSLFQSPRPERRAFSDYYQHSPSMLYWGEIFLPQVATARNRLLFGPKAEQVSQLCSEQGCDVGCIIDVGAGAGFFLDAWMQLRPRCRGIALEPHAALAATCRAKGYEVVEQFAEDAPPDALADLAVSLEVLEHAYDPLAFVQAVHGLVKPSGSALFTTLTSSGFDIQVLWDKAQCVIPPQHLNFMSLEGLEALMKRAGFQSVTILTPGKLDVDIVRKVMERDDAPHECRFLATLMQRSPETLQAFQRFLQDNRLSSHCWIWATKGT